MQGRQGCAGKSHAADNLSGFARTVITDGREFGAWMEAAGYTGPVEVEIFSDHWWTRPADEVLDTCIQRYKTVV